MPAISRTRRGWDELSVALNAARDKTWYPFAKNIPKDWWFFDWIKATCAHEPWDFPHLAPGYLELLASWVKLQVGGASSARRAGCLHQVKRPQRSARARSSATSSTAAEILSNVSMSEICDRGLAVAQGRLD